jgi:1,4-alpha-glucan branching enzyme
MKKQRTTLVVPNLDAKDVLVTGDFTGWSAEGVRLKRRRDGCWSCTVTLEPGEHEYRLIVDGEWRNNPGAARRVANGFGSENDVVAVSAFDADQTALSQR